MSTYVGHIIQAAYLITAVLFILGLKRMSSPATARSGIVWAGFAMLIAVLVTFLTPGLNNIGLILLAIVIGTAGAWVSGKKVKMTNMPQMVAIYNGMGGGAAAAIAAVVLLSGSMTSTPLVALAVIGGLIGSIAFSGSLLAFAKLQGLMTEKAVTFPMQQKINFFIFGIAVLAGLSLLGAPDSVLLIAVFFIAALAFGILMTLPIGGADMPVVISLFNALTGMAVAFEGFAIGNAAMIVAGTVVGAAGTLLTQLMAKAMNRPLSNVLFGSFGQQDDDTAEDGAVQGSLKEIEISDAAIMLGYANKVIIAPGYGMAVAQAQHKVKELTDMLAEKGVEVKFAIHPVAGRMPGHMNVLLAEAGVDYDLLNDLEEINPEFNTADVAIVIGANDVVNPAAKDNTSSPVYGMPILDVYEAKNILIIKRGKGKGFAGIENELFFRDNTRMLYGDAKSVANDLVQAIKQV